MPELQKDLTISLLIDFYGEMLTEKQKEVITFYYDQDLSLAEIARHSGITRQGVRDSIKRAERQLLDLEEKLGLYKKYHYIQEGLDKVAQLAAELQEENKKLHSSKTIESNTREIIEIVATLNY